MEPDHWIRVKEILAEALDQVPSDREAFVRNACGQDGALLESALKMLNGYSHASETLSQPLLPFALSEQPEQLPRFPPSTVVAQRFRILRLIARGGMGEVYEAEDMQLGVHVALKTIRPDIAADERVLDLFKNEIQTARRVTHANVCRIYDLAQHSEPTTDGSNEVTLFLTMELIEGETLSEYLKTHGAFTREDALPLIGQLASALQAAHRAGVIHRDFKPANVILAPGGDGKLRVVVMDFGLAVARAQSPPQPLPGAAGGTPAYMAPEQKHGGNVTPATDVYALGIVIAEMVGGNVRPAPASRFQTQLNSSTDSSDATLQVPQTFHRWVPVLLRCLEQDPMKRYSNPLEVFEALAEANGIRTSGYRRRNLKMVAAGILVAILGLIVVLAQRYRDWPVTEAATYRKLGPDDGLIGLWRPSPDGRYFAITDWNTGNLGLSDIHTGEIRLLTNKVKSPDEGQVLSAVFSPDGDQIAYSWLQNDVTELRINNIRTGSDELLYRDPALSYCEVEDWSADGSRVLADFALADSGQIAVIAIADHSATFPLPSNKYGNSVFAPDSTHVVFSAPQTHQGIETDIFEVPIDGGPAVPLGSGHR